MANSFLKRTAYSEIHKSVCFEQRLIHTSPREGTRSQYGRLLAELNHIIICTSSLCVLGLRPHLSQRVRKVVWGLACSLRVGPV